MRIEEMISAIQKELKIQIDGRATPETWGAIYDRIVDPTLDLTSQSSDISFADPRSEKTIAKLLPEIRPITHTLVQKYALANIHIKIISRLITYAEQDTLYAEGRTTSGEISTNAKDSYSNHNFWVAFDIGVFEGNAYLGDSPKYKSFGAIGIYLGLERGGNWKTTVNQAHFQLRPAWAAGMTEKQMLAELRPRIGSDHPVYS